MGGSTASAWEHAKLRTVWAEDVDVDKVLPEHPRPQLVRGEWQSLNGQWDFALRQVKDLAPGVGEYDSKILVPFAVESQLSGVERRVEPDQAMWYSRRFNQEKPAPGRRVLLHFGAVDWDAKVYVNGAFVGSHQGGYDAFSIDITDALAGKSEHALVVRVVDPTDKGAQPLGKQTLDPGAHVYTAVSGIWQTVWLEEVPETYIESLVLTPKVDSEELELVVRVAGPDADIASVHAEAVLESKQTQSATGPANRVFRLAVPKPRLWSPSDPHLYDLQVSLSLNERGSSKGIVDRVSSYFGMRKVELREDEQGTPRIYLNNQATFNYGPLDQGWWPDGLYTAPTDQALKHDIEVIKRFGFNMCRKHVKVEPARWYYWCDRLGLMVWQDMPNGDRGIGWNENDLVRTPESEAGFRRELQAMMSGLHNHPCITVWVPFNEGWGQFKTNEIIGWIKQRDPTRLVDGPSGWVDRGLGDLYDFHYFTNPPRPASQPGRASVFGEIGGLSYMVKDHAWQESGSWGYHFVEDLKDLQREYRLLINNLWIMKGRGLAAAVYTQTTDVETEVNGLMTYDRKVIKIPPEKAKPWHDQLLGPPPFVTNIVPSSQEIDSPGYFWRYTTTQPPSGWAEPDFDDQQWARGRAGFGVPNTPRAVVRTEWNTSAIWARRHVKFPVADTQNGTIHLWAHHDEDARVYFNGKLIAELTGYSEDYTAWPLSDEAVSLLRGGEGVLAVQCRQTDGGQYIDLGLIAVSTGSKAAPQMRPQNKPAEADVVRSAKGGRKAVASPDSDINP